MKIKRFDQKLSLNKKTIANLDDVAMENLRGGNFVSGNACPIFDSDEVSCNCFPRDTQFTSCDNCTFTCLC